MIEGMLLYRVVLFIVRRGEFALTWFTLQVQF